MKKLTYTQLIKQLKTDLATSESFNRYFWAHDINRANLDIEKFAVLLKEDKRTAMCFAWLLSDYADQNPEDFQKALPYYFSLRHEVTQFDYLTSFANYWLKAGVPEDNEVEAIDILFDWLRNPKTNVTTRSRAINVLLHLTKKYPGLKNEFKNALLEQCEKHSSSFARRAYETLKKLELIADH